MTYQDELTAREKDRVVIWDFPIQETRFVTRVTDGMTLPGGWTQFVGCTPGKDRGNRLDISKGILSTSQTSFDTIDASGALTVWNRTHDGTISQTQVIKRHGFAEVDEAEFQNTHWVFEDYEVNEKTGGGYTFTLSNVLRPMTKGLYDDFGGDTWKLDDTVHNPNFLPSDTSITLKESPITVWRQPGFVIVVDADAEEAELIAYTTIGGASSKVLSGLTRLYYGVGNAVNFDSKNTDVHHVWVKRGSPVDIMLEMLTTTEAGGNGAYDLADGDGLGISTDYIDIAEIESVRDAEWPQPTFDGSDNLTSGNAILLVEKDPIDDVKSFLEKFILRPYALFPAVTANEEFSIATYFRIPAEATEIIDKWDTRELNLAKWKRNFASRVNNLSLQNDFVTGPDEYHDIRSKTQFSSVRDFGKSKQEIVTNRGGRTGRFGFPDYVSEDDSIIAADKIFLELANPWSPLTIRVFYEFRGVGITDSVRLTVPGLPDIASGVVGVEDDTFLVLERKVNDADGYVDLTVRIRRSVLRAAFVAPDSVDPDYNNASDADRERAYIVNDRLFFQNGDEGYTVV